MSRSHSDKSGGRYSRRRFLVAGGTTAAMGLAGCTGDGGSEDTETEGDGGSTATETDSEGTTVGDAGEEQVTVSFWPAWGGYYEETFTQMVANFEEEHPNITIDMSAQGSYAESRSALFNAANAGNPPDVGHLDKGDAIIAKDSGFFTPIEEIWPDMNPDDYIGPAIGTSVIEGTTWSIPFNNSQIIMYYNKDHFEEAGLDPESPPDNWEELASAANTIVDEGVADYGVSWPNHNWWINSWMAEREQFVCDQKNGRAGEPTEVYYNTEDAQAVFDFWINDIGDAYHNPGIKNWGASEQAFQNGVASMHMNSSGSLAYSLSGFEENDINVGVAALPVPGDRIGHSMGGAAVWVSDKDRSDAEREAIATFLENMTGADQQAYYSKQTGYFPSHKESFTVLEDQGFYEDNPDTYKVSYEQYKAWEKHEMNQGILMGPASDIYQEVESQSDEMLQGKAINEAAQAIKEFGDSQLERYERV
jgi:sn-glycerol 3-phosphate transport system substrate-binding protein